MKQRIRLVHTKTLPQKISKMQKGGIRVQLKALREEVQESKTINELKAMKKMMMNGTSVKYLMRLAKS